MDAGVLIEVRVAQFGSRIPVLNDVDVCMCFDVRVRCVRSANAALQQRMYWLMFACWCFSGKRKPAA